MSIIEVHHGKQALDIQLASYLGYLIGTEPADTEYYIISKDKGYRNVQSFWPDRRIVLCRNLSPDSEIVDEPAPENPEARYTDYFVENTDGSEYLLFVMLLWCSAAGSNLLRNCKKGRQHLLTGDG